jgi:hypothetical protein
MCARARLVLPHGTSVAETRPSTMSSAPPRRLRHVIALVLGVAAFGCGSAAENTEDPGPPQADLGERATLAGGQTSCTPSIGLTERAGEPMDAFVCPDGYRSRERPSALPMSGRFVSAREIVDAFCARDDGQPGNDEEVPPVGIDFTVHDVVAIAHDGDVTMYRHGSDLWVRQIAPACDDDARSYRTVLFLVPKTKELREQYCSRACD